MVLLDPISTFCHHLPTVQPRGQVVLLSVKNSGENLRLASKDDTKKKVEKDEQGNATCFLSGKNKKQYLDVHTYIEFLCVFVCIVTAWL